ncbi:alpha-crystallin A chain-like [Littorina saxatilis]|uniref:SHSP domain-containing protein n=1 Tax=Littorina saxatilis TaxID=31220 RepID=A0AAN9B3Z8_9CAEN
MEHLVPLRKEDWGFFDRQRSTFSSMFKGMDEEFKEFDKELEQMRSSMFHLKAPDFNDFGSSMLKVDHPIVQDAQGNKRLSLRFDCKEFKPEEISVKTVDNRLMVQAKHTEESPGRKVYREFSRQYVLPEKIDPMTLNSSLTADGVLSIEGPAPAAIEAPRERILPIKQLM